MKRPSFFLLFLAAAGLPLAAAENLIPKPDALTESVAEGVRAAYPFQGAYLENHRYASVEGSGSAKVFKMTIPKGVTCGAGAKMESCVVKAAPGEKFRMSVEVKGEGVFGKVWGEAWAINPRPSTGAADPVGSKGKLDYMELAAQNGVPPLVVIYRAQQPDIPEGSGWKRVAFEFEPFKRKARVAGKEASAAYVSLKVWFGNFGCGPGTGYARDFKIERIR
jgi:hypothetical protein